MDNIIAMAVVKSTQNLPTEFPSKLLVEYIVVGAKIFAQSATVDNFE
jgi:hypothetical protein